MEHLHPPGEAGHPDAFCILPWHHLIIRPGGNAQQCNMTQDFLLTPEGEPLSVYGHSLDDIWNSAALRALRRDMAEGRRPPACRLCHELEDAGGTSLRQQMNAQAAASLTPSFRVQAGQAQWRAQGGPSFLQLDIGNLCNLKCRSCSGAASSRIARDPVHVAWSGGAASGGQRNDVWFRQQAILHEVLRRPEDLQSLHFLGGEPLLTCEIGDILRLVIEAGAAAHVVVSFHTNATTVNVPWLGLVRHFAGLAVYVSADGFGKHYEYLRYPARWEMLVRNVRWLRDLPNSHVEAFVIVQAYNALNVVELFRYFDAIGLPFCAMPLAQPPHLRASALPPPVRRLAAARLHEYVECQCKPEHRDMVRALIPPLEHPGDALDADLLWRFMLFTNDLDATRGQSFRATFPELLGLIEEAGFAWTDESLYAGRRPLTLVE